MASNLRKRSSISRLRQRVMGHAENALVVTSQQRQGYMKVGEVLCLRGPYIALETLVESVGRLQLRHPFLRSRLKNNPGKPNTYLMEEDYTLELKIVEISRSSDDHLDFWRQEWRAREKEPAAVGQGLAEFWLLQDPNDRYHENSPREIVVICEHSICDGLSLSTVAHELLLSLSNDDTDIFETSLNWPVTLESAVRRSLSPWNRVVTFGSFVSKALRWRATSRRRTARIPLTTVDFPLIDMVKHCHTEAFYARLNKEDTRELLEKCRREGVTVTSAVSSAILCAISALVSVGGDQATQLVLAIAADTRQRCVPQVPNHDLSFQASATMVFSMPRRDTPTIPQGMWQLATTFGNHVKKSIDAGHTLALAMMLGRLYQKSMDQPNLAEVPTCLISNWGRLPFQERYGKWELLGTTPFLNLIQTVMPFIFVQTVNGVLTIGCIGSVPIMSPNVLENLCHGTIRNLHQMIEQILTLRF